MATKKQTSSAKKTSSTSATVTRIKAVDSTATTKVPAKKQSSAVTQTKTRKTKSAFGRIGTPIVAMGRYFKGAWYELGQVRWPTRRATWGLTGAVLAFSLFFVVLILLLDAGFKYLFDVILGK